MLKSSLTVDGLVSCHNGDNARMKLTWSRKRKRKRNQSWSGYGYGINYTRVFNQIRVYIISIKCNPYPLPFNALPTTTPGRFAIVIVFIATSVTS